MKIIRSFKMFENTGKVEPVFEEMNRITVTKAEKDQLRNITRFYISILKSTTLKSGVNETRRLEYDLDSLKSLIKKDNNISIQHCNDGYKTVDSIAKQLSVMRNVKVIFDRNDNCFKTESGKAMVTFNFLSKSTDIEAGGVFLKKSTAVFINYKTGSVFNDTTKHNENDPSYIKVWDFTGGKIVLPIDGNRKTAENNLYPDMFSIIYHEFTHAKDPICWLPIKGYSTPASQKTGAKGSYGSHETEIQTMFNNLLELVAYYFERTWRGDTDGGGLNYNLTREELMKNFFPTLSEVRDFIRNKRTDLSQNAMQQLSGTNKNIKFIKKALSFMNDAKTYAPDKMEFVYKWMEEDFIKLSETFNKKITEINKKKPKGKELPLMNIVKTK